MSGWLLRGTSGRHPDADHPLFNALRQKIICPSRYSRYIHSGYGLTRCEQCGGWHDKRTTR